MFATKIYRRYHKLQPYLGFIYNKFLLKPTFSGWGMTTHAQLPWIDEYQGEIFRKANQDVKDDFQYNKTLKIYLKDNDEALWRHWNVSYAVRHSIEFANTNEYNFAECGVADGMSAFFALREITNKQKEIKNFFMHLYDSWGAMKEEDLLESELSSAGKYAGLDINITKQNLSEFKDNTIYHQGYIPDSLTNPPDSPNSIVYLHIDLNSANATMDALKFFFPRIVRGGVILFDDYGSLGHPDTKKVVDKFFSDKPGILMKNPTGQAIYYR